MQMCKSAEEKQKCRSAEVQVQVQGAGCRGAEVQRCRVQVQRSREVGRQRSRGEDMQKCVCAGAEVQIWTRC